MTESILMVVYSSVSVPGTEFIALDGSLPYCLNSSEPHVVNSSSVLIVSPAVVQEEGNIIWISIYSRLLLRMPRRKQRN